MKESEAFVSGKFRLNNDIEDDSDERYKYWRLTYGTPERQAQRKENRQLWQAYRWTGEDSAFACERLKYIAEYSLKMLKISREPDLDLSFSLSLYDEISDGLKDRIDDFTSSWKTEEQRKKLLEDIRQSVYKLKCINKSLMRQFKRDDRAYDLWNLIILELKHAWAAATAFEYKKGAHIRDGKSNKKRRREFFAVAQRQREYLANFRDDSFRALISAFRGRKEVSQLEEKARKSARDFGLEKKRDEFSEDEIFESSLSFIPKSEDFTGQADFYKQASDLEAELKLFKQSANSWERESRTQLEAWRIYLENLTDKCQGAIEKKDESAASKKEFDKLFAMLENDLFDFQNYIFTYENEITRRLQITEEHLKESTLKLCRAYEKEENNAEGDAIIDRTALLTEIWIDEVQEFKKRFHDNWETKAYKILWRRTARLGGLARGERAYKNPEKEWLREYVKIKKETAEDLRRARLDDFGEDGGSEADLWNIYFEFKEEREDKRLWVDYQCDFKDENGEDITLEESKFKEEKDWYDG